jgi:hypothetical protein
VLKEAADALTLALTSSLPLTRQVSAGVRLPSHISAFGENSSDEQLDSLPDAVLEENHAGTGADACTCLWRGISCWGYAMLHYDQMPDSNLCACLRVRLAAGALHTASGHGGQQWRSSDGAPPIHHSHLPQRAAFPTSPLRPAGVDRPLL